MSEESRDAINEVIDQMISKPAQEVMKRVGLTDEDFADMPQGMSFEEFNTWLDDMMQQKRR